MSKIVRVQGGDYKVIVGSSSTPGYITLDTNPVGAVGVQGKVTITGDLEVLGNTTTVQSETLTIKDNIIYLNVGETNAGVATLGTSSGFTIDRGTLPDVSVLWDETILSIDPTGALTSDPSGTFVFKDANSNLRAIATNSINTFGSNLSLIGEGNGVITVAGTTDYEENIIDYTKLITTYSISAVERTTNVATVYTTTAHGLISGERVYVFCTSNPTFNVTLGIITGVPTTTSFTYSNVGIDVALGALGSATGTVRPDAILDDDRIPNTRAVVDFANNAVLGATFNKILENDTKVQVYDFDTSGVSKITFDVDGSQRAVINTNGLTVDNIRIKNNTISNISNDNILIDNVINIANKVSTPLAVAGYVKLYSKNTVGTGGTGLYFVNTLGTNDELISKTKALLYSLIL
jgi:hypothetical protein